MSHGASHNGGQGGSHGHAGGHGHEDPIERYQQLSKKAKNILATTAIAHSHAYTSSTDVLKDEEGNVDYELLENPEMQKKFVDKMSSYYLDRANAYFGTKLKPEDQFQVDQLMQAYSGITKSALFQTVQRAGKNYTLQTHERQRDSLIKRIGEQLTQSASGHLTREHVPSLVEHMKAKDLVNPEHMELEDALSLYHLYDENKALTPEMIENSYRSQGQPTPHFLLKKPEPHYTSAGHGGGHGARKGGHAYAGAGHGGGHGGGHH